MLLHHFACLTSAGFYDMLAGIPAWNAVTDDAKLLLGGEAEYTELVQKYGEKAVESRQKFLSEAEYGSSAAKTSR